MKNLFIRLLFIISLVYQGLYANTNLEESMEVKFASELQELAQQLEYDPVKIYHWVYNNIEFEAYEGSRKNALSTYWTKRGNEWDQTSLLITLMRISNIPARYIKYGNYDNVIAENNVIAEIYVSTDNYRGVGISSNKTWIPLVAWAKEYDIEKGIDLFPDGNIPDELNFDFNKYVGSVKQKTALEFFEQDLQKYLNEYYPGKSLKDIPYKKTIIKKKSSILPLSLPLQFNDNGDIKRFATIENENRVQVKIYLKRYSNKEILMEQVIYLPEISTSRLVVDFLPNSQADKNIIDQYGLIAKTPEGKANVKAILRLDGKIINESLSLKTGENFIYGYEINGKKKDRFRKQAGTLLSLTYDYLNISSDYITKLKIELNDISIDVLKNDETKEEYLGRYATIMNSQYQERTYEAISLSDDYLHIRRIMYKSSIVPTLMYTFLDNINPSNNEKYLIHPSWNIDASNSTGHARKIENDNYIKFLSKFGIFSSKLHTYGASYNEGLIFEDWQSTPSGNSIKALMVANEQGIPVVTLTKDDIQNGHIYILENQTVDRYSYYSIKRFIENIQNDNAIIITPVRKVNYEGLVMSVSLTFADNYIAYFFNMNHGGGSTDVTKENENITTTPVSHNIKSENYVTADIVTIDFSSGATPVTNTQNSQTNVNNTGAYSEKFFDGDPVDMVKGEFYQIERPDISIKSRGFNLEIKRTYKSQSTYNGIFGYGWTWAHMERIIFAVDGSLIYFDENGTPVNITENSDGSYSYAVGSTYTLKKENNLYIITLKDNSQKIFGNDGLLIKKIDSYGNYLTFEYNESYNINKISDSIGRSLSLHYNANGKVETVTDFLGRVITYEYDENDLISFTDLADNTTRYEYLKNQDNPANNHNMSKYILPTGDFLNIGYYKNDQVSHHTNKKDETFHFQYSRYNRYSETWNEEGYYRKVFFNEQNDVIRISTKDNTIELKEYDINHNMVTRTDANGYKTTYTYDDKRNMLSKTNALNEKWIYEYDSRHNKKTTIIDPLGNIKKYIYDDNGNLLQSIDTLNKITSYEYDKYGNKIKTIDAVGSEVVNNYDIFGINRIKTIDKNENETSFEYDQIGNTISVTDALSNKKQIEYNPYNKKSKIIDAKGYETLYEYTKNVQLKRTTLPSGAVYEKVYDTARDIVTKSLVLEDIDPLGNSIKYRYDKVGNKIEQIDKRGNVYKFTYDALNKMISKTDPLNNTTYYSYDANGKLVKEKSKRLVGDVQEDVIITYKYDEVSRLIEKTDPNGLVTNYNYNKLGKLTQKSYTVDSINIVSAYEYNKQQQLIKKTDGYGSNDERVTSYEYDNLGRKTKEINPLNIETSYTYDNNSNLLSKTINNRIVLTYKYDKLNRVTDITNANGNITSYKYDENFKKISTTNPKGDITRYSYDNAGNIIEETSPGGNIKSYRYNLLNKPIELIDSKNNSKYITYDENSNIIKTIDANKNTIQHFYDELNRKVVTIDAQNNKTTYSYDEAGNIISQTDAANSTILYSYDKNKNMIRKTNLLENEELIQSYTYDKLNRVISITDVNANQTIFVYSVHNEKISTANAKGDITKKVYDKLSRPIQTIDAKGIITKLEYNNFSNLVKVTQALGLQEEVITSYTYDNIGNRLSQTKAASVTTYNYDKLNNLVKTTIDNISSSNKFDMENNLIEQTDANGNITTYIYDENKNLIQKQNTKGNIYKYTYDNNNNLLSQTSPQGKVKQFQYNELNQKVKYIEGNAVKEITYHKNGKVKDSMSFNGVITSYEYDSLNRVIQKTEAKDTQDEAVTKYIYDNNSNLISITNAKGVTVYYEYNTLNQKTKKINGDNTFKEFFYDKNSNLIKEIKEDGTIVEYSYDNLNRKVKTIVNNQLEQEFSYDNLSRLITSKNHNQNRKINTVSYVYDNLNNITKSTQNGKVVDKQYDNNSNLLNLKVDNNIIQTNSYDKSNKLTQIENYATMSYDNDNKINSIEYNNGIINTISTDNRNREIKREYKKTDILYSQETSYDENSNIVKEIISKNNNEIIKEYAYDKQDRLLKDIYKDHSFQYDKVGNQIFTTQNNIPEYRDVNLDNEYTSITDSNIEYDVNGNVKIYKDKEFIYDYSNRLVELKKDNITIATYTYDAQNRRVEKILSDKTITYIYNNNQVIQEYENDTLTNSYIYASYIDDPIAYTYNNNTYYYVKDRQYSIQAITNSSGQIVESYSYSSFGIMTMKDQNGGIIFKSNVNNTITFTGRRYDSESGLYYYRNRMYSAELGRFISKDPKGYIDGMNLYAYVKNNPLKYLDAFGTTAYQSFSDSFGNGIVSYSISGRTDDFTVTYDNSGFGNSGDANYIYNNSEVRVQENDNYFGAINDKSYEFTIVDSHLPQDERDPNRLTAHIAYRGLGPVPFTVGEDSEYLEKNNMVVGHQHIWWNDGYNRGFHNKNGGEIFREEPEEMFTYDVWNDKEYEGDAMKNAVNVTTTGTYDMCFSGRNNCQDFVDRVDLNYDKMVNIYE